ncbi:hypothetical protein [Arthrobacter roseus]|uniref:hypothetical protein n=1 Tax=Arthrobacter roseus TaxID=136274 RepID=UPI001966A36E|nr:hypothetical protein [Arthrobacter roseus]MBM7847499.1 hypothetical protein [Arthrobacter roseus]
MSNELTIRQVEALTQAHTRIHKIIGTHLGDWSIRYAEEIRPGRGHDITAWVADGEHTATQYLDPYGNGPLIVSRMIILHNDADEEHFDDEGNCNHDEDQP